jgi:hypothetical protein
LASRAIGSRPTELQGVGSGQAFAAHSRLAMAEHDRGHVGERGEVAGGADRAFFRDDRNDPFSEHAFDEFDQLAADAGSATAERQEFQRHDEAHDVFGSGSPTPQQCDRIRLR